MNGGNRLPPGVPDRQTGLDFLSALPLANPAEAEQGLLQFLDRLLANPLAVGDMLPLLERARAPVNFVEEESARRYCNKPLPLSDAEEAGFLRVVSIWRRMEQAYALCARLQASDSHHPQSLAVLLQRCLFYAGRVIHEHYRARRELPPGVWLALHGYYATAEKSGVAMTPVEDALENSRQSTHCSAAYVTLLLLDMASPYRHSVRHLNLIRRWAGMWAPLVSVHALADDEEVPPCLVELTKDAPLHPMGRSESLGPDARSIDTTRLGLQIDHLLGQLHQRIKPSQLGLGEETGSQVQELLARLSKPWTQSAAPRKFRRFAATGGARLATGFEAMHYHVGKKPFTQPSHAQAYSRDAFDTLFTFRDRVDPARDLSSKPHQDFPADEWSVINHSANGFRLSRSRAGQRIAHAQLLALMPHDGERFLLCRTRWLMQEADGRLAIGADLLPGMPTALGVRLAGTGERYVPAFLLPPVPATKEPASLVVPPGMYMAQRLIEIFAGTENRQLRLLQVIERGTDYERISYEPA